jgi:hypothetical protein
MMQYVHVTLNPGLPWQKQHSSRRRLFHQQIRLKRKNLVKCCIWSITLCGAETYTLQGIDKKYYECFEMWY